MKLTWQPADFWHLAEGRPTCLLCPFRCAPEDGKTGRCQVRRRQGNGWETACHHTAVYHWQTIERKPFYHLHPGAPVLTLTTPGCTFRCDYCENAVISQVDGLTDLPFPLRTLQSAEVLKEVRERRGLLAFSYSEPTLAAEWTLEFGKIANESGIRIVWNSNGFITQEALIRVAPFLSAVNIDIKTADPNDYYTLTGGGRLSAVLEAMAGFRALGVWVEVSTPLIPGFNDNPASVLAMAREVLRLGAETPWHLLRFHPDHRRSTTPPTPPGELDRAKQIAHEAGLYHVYTPHGLDAAGQTTHCPDCGRAVIQRERHTLIGTTLHNGCCPDCGKELAGRWL